MATTMRTKKKNRRGSVLVLVALMLGVLMAVAAIGADIGRFYVVTGELQTAADAAALKGASVLQMATSNYDAVVDGEVIPFASTTNRTDGDNVDLVANDVEVGFWTPGVAGAAGIFGAAPTGARPNAVKVTTRRSPRGVFSQMIGRTAGLPLSRTAIAWIGNLSLNCTRPWALNYLPLVQAVNGNADTTKSLDMARFVA